MTQHHFSFTHDYHDFIHASVNNLAYDLFCDAYQHDHMLFISGVAASGKSLLCNYWVDGNSNNIITEASCSNLNNILDKKPKKIAIDNLDQCSLLSDETLFHLYNYAKAYHIGLLFTSRKKHNELLYHITLPDWHTRFTDILSAHIDDGDEDLLLALMTRYCENAYIMPNIALFQYIITHYTRQYAVAINVIQEIIAISLQEKQKLTIPFAKSIIEKKL